MERRCYRCDQRPARYAAHLDYDCTPEVLLCADCIADERSWDSVLTAHSLPRRPDLEREQPR